MLLYVLQVLLFDIESDYQQLNPVNNSEVETEMKERLILEMERLEAPEEQYQRLGLR